MPASPEDVLRALRTLTSRGEGTTPADIAAELQTAGLVRRLNALQRAGLVWRTQRPDGVEDWGLTKAGERKLAEPE